MTQPPDQGLQPPRQDDAGLPADPAAGLPARPASDPAGALSGLWAAVREVALVLVIALGLSLLVKTVAVQAFFVPSESMQTVLEPGDRMLVDKLVPRVRSLHRGDVVVFADRGKWLGDVPPAQHGAVGSAVGGVLTFVGLLPSSEGHLVKRVIGLPGDTVTCCDASGRLSVNGKVVDEPYLFPGDRASGVNFSVTVPAGRIWVMGDHRSDSSDSRAHRDDHDGTVAVDDVVGKAFVVVWPVGRWHRVRAAGSVFDGVPEPR